jgi:hypothetical protein
VLQVSGNVTDIYILAPIFARAPIAYSHFRTLFAHLYPGHISGHPAIARNVASS